MTPVVAYLALVTAIGVGLMVGSSVDPAPQVRPLKVIEHPEAYDYCGAMLVTFCRPRTDAGLILRHERLKATKFDGCHWHCTWQGRMTSVWLNHIAAAPDVVWVEPTALGGR